MSHPLPANLLDTRIRGPRWPRIIMLGLIGAIGGALLGVECATLVTPTYRAAASLGPLRTQRAELARRVAQLAERFDPA